MSQDTNNYTGPASTEEHFQQSSNCSESDTDFQCAEDIVAQQDEQQQGQPSDSGSPASSGSPTSSEQSTGVPGSEVPPGSAPSTSGNTPPQEIAQEDLDFYGKQLNYILGSNANGVSYDKFVSYDHPTLNTLYYGNGPSDLIRYNLGSYWGEKTENGKSELKFFYGYGYNNSNILLYNARPIMLSNIYPSFINNDLILRRKPRDLVDSNGVYLEREFQAFVEGYPFETDQNIIKQFPGIFQQDVEFLDFSIVFNTAFSQKEKNETGGVLNSLMYDMKTDYVFYDSKFEKFSSQGIVGENKYPNLYISSFYRDLENPTDKVRQVYTFDGFLDSTSQLNKNYFHLLIDAHNQNQNNVKETKNIFFSVGQLKKLNSLNSAKYLFPMYSELSFSLSKTRKFSNILKESGFLNSFCKELAKKVISNQMQNLAKYVEDLENKNLTNGQEEQLISQANNPVKYIDFNSVYNLCKQVTDDGDLVVIDDSLNNNSDNKNLFLKTINDLIFKQKKKKLEEQKKRTFQELIETGKNCYSETLMYRIAKFKGNTASGEPIQNIFIINEPDTDIVDYVDTQVKYDQEYTYRVFSYEVIIGNKYKYTDMVKSGGNPRPGGGVTPIKYTISYENEIETGIIELPYLDQTVRIYDSPPPPPEVSIEYYKGNDRSLLIMMNSSANTYKARPILIDEKDEEIFKKASQQQQVEFGEKIEFSSDDKINKFQIFRTDVPPDKFEDFNGQLIKEIEAVDASSAAFVDSILPNKKYYYTFRSVDVHDKVSNPIDVYEIEMISEKGTIFAIKNIYSLKRQPKKSQTRSLKRFLRIRPTISHELINNETEVYSQESLEQALEKANLGLTEKSVWSKKFKLRLVSKNSNKVLDVNFKFDTLKQQYSVNNSENN